jgi:hypothetical protein
MGVNSNGTLMMDQGVFKNLGSVTWDTTAKTTGFTAVSGNGYFVNTTSGAITVTLPSSPSAGDVVGIKDYANTADTNAITIGRNGSNIDGVANDFTITTEGLSALLVYVDATKGWLITNSSQASDISEGPTFITATGGTITTCGDYKIHTFTSPGTFCVSSLGNPAGGPNNVYWQVVAGGGGGGGKGQEDVQGAGGGGAGGYRTNFPGPAPGGFPISASPYPISVGGGGAGGPNTPGPSGSPTRQGSAGSNSVFACKTSAGGGQGGGSGGVPACAAGGNGGSGGGGGPTNGSGNTPPVSPPQGNNGGTRGGTNRGGGGGGASAAGANGAPPSGGAGGAGSANSITGSPITRAGGGGGGGYTSAPGGAGGAGGGGAGALDANATSGTTNTGGGGGGVGGPSTGTAYSGGSGGSGIVIIRYKFQ